MAALLTARDAAAYLGVSRDTLRRLARGGHIPSWTDPDTGWRRYSKPALDRWLIENCEIPATTFPSVADGPVERSVPSAGDAPLPATLGGGAL